MKIGEMSDRRYKSEVERIDLRTFPSLTTKTNQIR